MNTKLRNDAEYIIRNSIKAVLPDEAVIRALKNYKGSGGKTILVSVESDGTDGPTDAAGGYVDTDTLAELEEKGVDIHDALANNDSYNALKAVGGLIITGPTGTNVNDVAVVLVDSDNEQHH